MMYKKIANEAKSVKKANSVTDDTSMDDTTQSKAILLPFVCDPDKSLRPCKDNDEVDADSKRVN